jgi:hypothetical protein
MRKVFRNITISVLVALLIIASTFALAAYYLSSGDSKTPAWVDHRDYMVNSLVIMPKSDAVVAGSGDSHTSGAIMLLNVSNGRTIWNDPVSRIINTLAVSGNGSFIVAGGYQLNDGPAEEYQNGAVYFLNDKGSILWNFSVDFGPPFGVGISKNGSIISVDCPNGKMYLDTAGQVVSNRGSTSNENSSQNGSYVSTTNSEVLFYGQNRTLIRDYPVSYGYPTAVTSSDGSHTLVFVWGTFGQTIMLFNNQGSKDWGYSAEEVHAGAISNNGSLVVASAGPGGSFGEHSTLYFFTNGSGNTFAGLAGFFWSFIDNPLFILFEGVSEITIIGLAIALVVAIFRGVRFKLV